MKRSLPSLDSQSLINQDDTIQTLGPSQKLGYSKILAGDSLFLTGSAGTGKSHIIKLLIKKWDELDHKYAITATTGIAAVNISGKTIHSFMWFTVDDEFESAEKFLNQLMLKPGMYKFYERQMRQLQTLIIDEVSMLHHSVLEKINDIFKIVRSNSLPFGGIQIVLVGDFYQLPAVKSDKFLFQSDIFKVAAPQKIILKETFRQSDPIFISLLGRMRTGQLNENDKIILRSRVGADVTKFGIIPTQLWSTNKDVDRINQEYLSQIKSKPYEFSRFIGIRSDASLESQKSYKDKFSRDINSAYPETFILKGPEIQDKESKEFNAKGSDGAQVMLTYNLDQSRGLVNGSRGVVMGFEMATFSECNQLSTSFDILDRQILYPKNILLPIVKFIIDGCPTNIKIPFILIQRKLNDKKDKVFAWIMPLKLAWASTVHKSQGQSLECVKISLDRSIFENGQAYVAVSRARSLEGLQLTCFEESVVSANEEVKKFYND